MNCYNQRNIDTMEMVYGKGYLSAGGDQEVVSALQGIDLSGKRVLDLGCGLGGASIAIARNLGVSEVVGFDIDEVVLERADLLIKENELSDRIRLVKGSPGPLPFEDDKFDLVYVTAVSCHIQDLAGFFGEINRVLKPEGWLAGLEWLIREDNQAYRNWDDLLRERGLNFYFVDKPAFEKALYISSFQNIDFDDRTDAFTGYANEALAKVQGELKDSLLLSLGDDGYSAFLEWTHARYRSFKDGGVYQQRFRAQNSATG